MTSSSLRLSGQIFGSPQFRFIGWFSHDYTGVTGFGEKAKCIFACKCFILSSHFHIMDTVYVSESTG